jgi:hypothetical protein
VFGVSREPLAAHGLLGGGVVHLQAAHLRAAPAGQHRHLVVDPQPARHERPGDHRAEALHREDTVDRQARGTARRAAGRTPCEREEGLAEPVHPLSRPRGHGNARRVREERPGHQLARLHPDELDGVRVREVRLGDRDEAVGDAEEPTDLEVLARLRHHRLVGRHDEDDGVEPPDAGEHVLDEPFVSGHVHERERELVGGPVGEPEVDGDAAGLLLLQPIRVGAGEGEHQRALAVIDVTGGADDDVPRRHVQPRRRRRSFRPGRCRLRPG